jgi:hypothetical protein
MVHIQKIENILFGTIGPFVSEIDFSSEQKTINFVENYPMSIYQIFTNLGHMIPLWKGKNPIYFGVIRSKVKVTVTITLNRIFDNRVVSA